MSQLHVQCRHRYRSGFEIDFEFETRDRVTALSGPSGSGKTSVLRIIAGLLRPREGHVSVEGRVLTDTTGGQFIPAQKRHVGLLFQDYCLFPHLSAEANIGYGARRRRGMALPTDRVVQTLELQPLLGRMPRSLSGGEQQRVALARAVVSNPRILLLDEPLNAVEEELRDRIAELIERVAEEFRIPILLVSHEKALLDRMAGRRIGMRNGRLDGS